MEIEFLQSGPVQIKTTTDGIAHREVRVPGDDISDLPDGVQSQINAHWTDERTAAYESTQQTSRDLPAEAKITRNDAINSPILYDGDLWDVDAKSRETMDRAIDTARRNGLEAQTRTWVLADNTPRSGVTISDLEAILDLYTLRMSEIFTQYLTWAAGDKSEPFTIT